MGRLDLDGLSFVTQGPSVHFAVLDCAASEIFARSDPDISDRHDFDRRLGSEAPNPLPVSLYVTYITRVPSTSLYIYSRTMHTRVLSPKIYTRREINRSNSKQAKAGTASQPARGSSIYFR